jgi:hypothetical protein
VSKKKLEIGPQACAFEALKNMTNPSVELRSRYTGFACNFGNGALHQSLAQLALLPW